jgi:hypothetical protein
MQPYYLGLRGNMVRCLNCKRLSWSTSGAAKKIRIGNDSVPCSVPCWCRPPTPRALLAKAEIGTARLRIAVFWHWHWVAVAVMSMHPLLCMCCIFHATRRLEISWGFAEQGWTSGRLGRPPSSASADRNGFRSTTWAHGTHTQTGPAARPSGRSEAGGGHARPQSKALSGDDSKGVPACEHPAGHDDSS